MNAVSQAQALLASRPAGSPAAAPAEWIVEAGRVVAALDASIVALDYEARRLLQRTGDLRAAARERSLLGSFFKSADEKDNLAAQERCRSMRATCEDLIAQLRSRMDVAPGR